MLDNRMWLIDRSWGRSRPESIFLSHNRDILIAAWQLSLRYYRTTCRIDGCQFRFVVSSRATLRWHVTLNSAGGLAPSQSDRAPILAG